MAVPKKRTSFSKKRIRKNIWKKKAYGAALKAFALAKSLSTGHSNSFFAKTIKYEIFTQKTIL
uniref:Large ribosomal subunit protein bL32c n=1 Tax=Talinum paniculatum TaxID=107604 RepID=A0A2R4SVI7_TALPA|nr:ribosomal protein L32 [Talinum paniculatum]AVZ66411.1 ribosomal protein L32 [Talinum paniculatum]